MSGHPAHPWGRRARSTACQINLTIKMNFKDQIYLEKTKTPQPKGWDFTSQDISQVLSLQITNHFHRRYFCTNFTRIQGRDINQSLFRS